MEKTIYGHDAPALPVDIPQYMHRRKTDLASDREDTG